MEVHIADIITLLNGIEEQSTLNTLFCHMSVRMLCELKSILVHSDGVTIMRGAEMFFLYFPVTPRAPPFWTSILKTSNTTWQTLPMRKWHGTVLNGAIYIKCSLKPCLY